VSRRLGQLEERLRHLAPPPEPAIIRQVRSDPAALLTAAGWLPDDWQADVLRSQADRLLMLCARQTGKSTTAAALALRTALLQPGSLTLILSPTLRQSGELFRHKVLPLWQALGSPMRARPATALALELSNGSRVISLPENEEGIRGYSGVSMLVIDEAARVAAELYRSVRPMLATSKGRLVALSTPFGRRGWFFDEWQGESRWERVKITAGECPRIEADFLAEERAALGDRWFRQEYECLFQEMAGAVFSGADIDALVARPVAARPFPA
jgi:hypothetical protein